MRTPNPTRAALDLRALAAILADGRWTRALELADAAASPLRAASGGRGAVGAHSDPTATAATTRPDPVPPVTALVSAYDAVRVALGARGGVSVHWVAGKLQGAAQLIGDTQTSADYGVLWHAVDRCLALHARTITPDAAAAHMQRKASEQAARYCVVCEAPLTPEERRSMCGPDYWLWRDRAVIRHLFTAQADGDPGSDRAHFVTWVRARISDPLHVDNRGVALSRPGSPLMPDVVPMVHEDEVV